MTWEGSDVSGEVVSADEGYMDLPGALRQYLSFHNLCNQNLGDLAVK